MIDFAKSNLPPIIGVYSSAPQSGKNTIVNFISLVVTRVKCLYPAEPLKAMAMELLVYAGYDELAAHNFIYYDKGEPLKLIPGSPTSRHIQQTLGTDWARKMIHPDVWAGILANRIDRERQESKALILCEGVRFPNEYAMICERGGQVWRVIRPGVVNTTGHYESEGLLDSHSFHHVIVNDGTTQDLRNKVLAILNTMK